MFKNFKISPDERKLYANPNSNDLDKNNLKGHVKSVIAVEIKDQNNSPMQFMPFAPRHRQLFEISDFNKKGEMLSYREVYEGNVVFMKKEYQYDENERLTDEVIFDENNNIIETIIFKHNEDGLMIEEFRKDYDILLTAFYDNNGYLEKVIDKSELQGYGEKTYIIKREKCQPDNISEIETIQNGELSYKSNFNFDSRGNVIKAEHYNAINDPLSSEVIQYDINDNISKLTTKNKRRTTEYSYVYEYDNIGNWIKFKFFINGEFNLESKREIQYY